MIFRSEFRPACLPVRLAASEVATEILDVCLPAGSMLVESVEWEAAFLDDEPRPLALPAKHSLDHSLVVGSGLHRDNEVIWGIANVNAPGAFPGAGEPGLHDAADLQVSLHRGDPAGEPLRLCDSQPEVVDVRVIDILNAHRTSA